MNQAEINKEVYQLLADIEIFMQENHPHGELHTKISDLLNIIDKRK